MAWRCACAEPQMNCFSAMAGGGSVLYRVFEEPPPLGLSAAINQLFLLLYKSFIMNMRCFCDVLVLERCLITQSQRAITKHVTVKHTHLPVSCFCTFTKTFIKVASVHLSRCETLCLDIFAFFLTHSCCVCKSLCPIC